MTTTYGYYYYNSNHAARERFLPKLSPLKLDLFLTGACIVYWRILTLRFVILRGVERLELSERGSSVCDV